MKALNIKTLYLLISFLPTCLAAQEKASLTLAQCKAMAKDNNVDIKNAALDVKSAQSLKIEAFTEYFPTISLNGFGYDAFNPFVKVGLKDVLGDSDGAQNLIDQVEATASLYGIGTTASFLDYGYNASVALTQPVFAGRRIVNGNRLASVNQKAAFLKQSTTTKEKALDVERKYWNVVSLEEKVLTVEKALRALDTLRRDASNACLAGLALDTDTIKVNLERNRLISSQCRLKSGIRLAKMNLFNAIGLEYSYISSVADTSRPFIDDILLSDRPSDLQSPEYYWTDEVGAAEGSEKSRLLSLNVESARIQKKMALGEVLPQVGVGAGYGYGRVIGDNGRWNGAIYVSVKIPLTDYWKASHKISRLDNEARKAENQQSYLTDQLVLQIRSLWEDLVCAYDKVFIAEQNVSLAEITESRMQDRYASGQATVSDVLTAQTDLRSAQDELTDSRIAYINALSAYRSHTSATARTRE